MKLKFPSSGVIACFLALLVTSGMFAQQPQEKSKRQQVEHESRLAALNADEQARLRAAHEKALTDMQVRAAHEHLQQARREFREVMRPAMLRADPSVQPILEKLRRSPRDRN